MQLQFFLNMKKIFSLFEFSSLKGNEFSHIQMLPFQQQTNYNESFPDFKLIDGPTVRQGRLQVRFRDRWRGVCSALTNWTAVDTSTACKSMGYNDGAFYTWFRRNNDTYPFVMPIPGCIPSAKNLWECKGFAKPENIPLSENLCQGEDDLGLYCWGQPTFQGWAKHWKGLQIYNSPYHFVYQDPDGVSVMRESSSRLEFIDIMFAGYDGAGADSVFRQFPVLRRDDPYFQTFTVSLTENSTLSKRAGFLQFYNATTGEDVPSCDRQFTRRNAQVIGFYLSSRFANSRIILSWRDHAFKYLNSRTFPLMDFSRIFTVISQ